MYWGEYFISGLQKHLENNNHMKAFWKGKVLAFCIFDFDFIAVEPRSGSVNVLRLESMDSWSGLTVLSWDHVIRQMWCFWFPPRSEPGGGAHGWEAVPSCYKITTTRSRGEHAKPIRKINHTNKETGLACAPSFRAAAAVQSIIMILKGPVD